MKASSADFRDRRLWPLGLVAILVWAMLLVVASQSTLWDRDEARYATASLEMAESGHWLYPTFNHELRAFKPVMIYWLMAASIRTFGPGEWSVRLVSTLAMAGVCLLTGLIAREFLGSGTLAAALAGTSPLMILNGTAATTDASLLLSMLLAQWVFVRAWLDGPRPWHVPALGVALGGALLIKGPVGLVIPVLSIGTALVWARGRSEAGPFAFKLVLAAGLGFLIFLAWGLPANAATGGEYWRIGVAERLPRRIFSAMEGHGGQGWLPYLLHIFYYPAILAVGFLPWTIYLVTLPWRRRRVIESQIPTSWARSREGFRVILIAMILPVLILMTLVVSKLPHYILPVFPWVAMFTAGVLASVYSGPLVKASEKGIWRAYVILGFFGLVAAMAAITLPWVWEAASVFRVGGLVSGLFLLILLGVMGRLFWQKRILAGIHVHAVGIGVFVLGVALLFLPGLEKIAKPAQRLGNEVSSQIPPDAEIAVFGWHEPSLHFYLGGRPILHLYDAVSLQEWLHGPGPRVLVLNEEYEAGVSPTSKGFRALATKSGLDVVHGMPIRLTAYLRE